MVHYDIVTLCDISIKMMVNNTLREHINIYTLMLVKNQNIKLYM